MTTWVTWRSAMERALYGAGGFYRRGEAPGTHFRTSVHVSSRFAAALLRMLVEVDALLDRPPRIDFVDLGAGRGELAGQIARLAASGDPCCGPAAPRHTPSGRTPHRTASSGLAARLRITAVDVAPRPAGLPAAVAWRPEPPAEITGLVVANEWLDNIPLDVVEQTPDGPRLVLVDPGTGEERLGSPASAADLAWLARWWPLTEVGDRAEIGSPRCAAWAQTVGRLRRGVAVAVDYAHARSTRPPYGSLAGYRDGRAVPAVPDGSCDITAHVALDACAAAGAAAGATATVLTTQRAALRRLGVHARRPAFDAARTDPRRYVAALSRAGEEAELIDPHGLGGFGWLVQTVGVPLPPSLACLATPVRR